MPSIILDLLTADLTPSQLYSKLNQSKSTFSNKEPGLGKLFQKSTRDPLITAAFEIDDNTKTAVIKLKDKTNLKTDDQDYFVEPAYEALYKLAESLKAKKHDKYAICMALIAKYCSAETKWAYIAKVQEFSSRLTYNKEFAKMADREQIITILGKKDNQYNMGEATKAAMAPLVKIIEEQKKEKEQKKESPTSPPRKVKHSGHRHNIKDKLTAPRRANSGGATATPEHSTTMLLNFNSIATNNKGQISNLTTDATPPSGDGSGSGSDTSLDGGLSGESREASSTHLTAQFPLPDPSTQRISSTNVTVHGLDNETLKTVTHNSHTSHTFNLSDKPILTINTRDLKSVIESSEKDSDRHPSPSPVVSRSSAHHKIVETANKSSGGEEAETSVSGEERNRLEEVNETEERNTPTPPDNNLQISAFVSSSSSNPTNKSLLPSAFVMPMQPTHPTRRAVSAGTITITNSHPDPYPLGTDNEDNESAFDSEHSDEGSGSAKKGSPIPSPREKLHHLIPYHPETQKKMIDQLSSPPPKTMTETTKKIEEHPKADVKTLNKKIDHKQLIINLLAEMRKAAGDALTQIDYKNRDSTNLMKLSKDAEVKFLLGELNKLNIKTVEYFHLILIDIQRGTLTQQQKAELDPDHFNTIRLERDLALYKHGNTESWEKLCHGVKQIILNKEAAGVNTLIVKGDKKMYPIALSRWYQLNGFMGQHHGRPYGRYAAPESVSTLKNNFLPVTVKRKQ